MLVLTRSKGEKIVIIDKEHPEEVIEITVVRINGPGSVRLGIQAPKNIRVDIHNKGGPAKPKPI